MCFEMKGERATANIKCYNDNVSFFFFDVSNVNKLLEHSNHNQ